MNLVLPATAAVVFATCDLASRLTKHFGGSRASSSTSSLEKLTVGDISGRDSGCMIAARSH